MFLNKKILCFIEYVWLLGLLIFVSLLYLSQKNIGLFFDSDQLLIPNFFKDIFLNNNHYNDWFLSPAPHFFPDMILYFPIIFVCKDIYLQFLVYIHLILLLTYFIIKYIYQLYFSKKKSTFFALTVISSLFVLAFTVNTPYMWLPMPAAHYGEFLIGLLLIIIITKLLDNNELNFKKYFLYSNSAILIFASSASDLLFIIQFVIPFFISYIFLYIKKYINFGKFLLISTLCIIPAMIGGLLSKYIVPHEILYGYLAPSAQKISLNTINIQLSAFLAAIKIAIKYLPGNVFLIFYLSLFFIIGMILFNKTKIRNFSFSIRIIFLCTVIFLSIIINAVVLCLFTQPSVITERYLIPLYSFPYILFFLPLYFLENYQDKYKIITFIFYIILINSIIGPLKLIVHDKIKPKLEYYPEEIKCIDKSLQEYGNHGVAEYWDANVVSILSKKNIEVVSLNARLEPVFFATNSTKFSKPSSFVIISHAKPLFDLNTNIVYATYGNPKKIIRCGEKTLLIYPKNSIKTPQNQLFSQSGDSFNWQAANLPSLIPHSKKGKHRIAKWTDIQNFISYGPYILLPEGSYHFYIKYSSDEIYNKHAVAYYDIYSRRIGIISKKFIYGSQGKSSEISGKFKVSRMQANKHLFEIRVFYLGLKKFVLDDITLVKD
jgi:hypothetical protein